MNKYDIYFCIFIFILIECVHSQDKNFYKTEPINEENEETNEPTDITEHTDECTHSSIVLGYDNYDPQPTTHQSEYPIDYEQDVYEQYFYDYGASGYYTGYEQEPSQPVNVPTPEQPQQQPITQSSIPYEQYQGYLPYQPYKDGEYNQFPITHQEYMPYYIPEQEPIFYYVPTSEFPNQPQQIPLPETVPDIYNPQHILQPSGYQPFEPNESQPQEPITESGPSESEPTDDEENNFDTIVKELEKLIDDDETDDPTIESVEYGNTNTDGNDSEDENFEVKEIAEESTVPELSKEESSVEKYTGDPKDKTVYGIAGPVKECKKINLFKRDSCGHFVSMVWPGEFEKIEDRYIIKWKNFNHLEAVRCDDSLVWKRGPSEPRPVSLAYHKTDCCFIFGYESEFVLIKWIKVKWSKKARKLPEYIKFYTIDSEGNDVELTPNDYTVEVNIKKNIRYKLNDCKCNKIIVRNMVVWENKYDNNYPTSVMYILSTNVLIFFNNVILSFGKRHGKYVLMKTINK
uniref:Theileria-specific sub-telomeric protein, SVSP family, putative n=1 Tax=Theileria annulata TaxID=5874 RepID=A0A3B0N7D4_THEAN